MMLKPAVLVCCLSAAQHVAQHLPRPEHDGSRRSSSYQGPRLTFSSKGAKGVRVLLQVSEDVPWDDYVFAACVRLRDLRLAWPTRPAKVTTDAKMTVAMCAERCKATKSIHFALGGGDSCLCFDHFDAAPVREPGMDPAVCDAPCAGKPSAKCGGKGDPQALQVYTYAHHHIEPKKDATWICGRVPEPEGVEKVTGDGQLRSVTCAKGYTPSESGGANLMCDAYARTWVPDGECISLEEALKKAKNKLLKATEDAKNMKKKADKAASDAADIKEITRKAQKKRNDLQFEAARLSRVACKELKKVAPDLEKAENSAELSSQGAADAAKDAADALKKAKSAAEDAENMPKLIAEAKKDAKKAAEAADEAFRKENAAAEEVAKREAAVKDAR